jgi:hypothetical protein
MAGLPDLVALYPEVVAEQRRNIARFLAGLVLSVAVSLLLVLVAEGLLRLVGLVGLVVCAAHMAIPVYWYIVGHRVEQPRTRL